MRATIQVWDPLVRLFHWALAGCFLATFLVEEGDTVHQWLGYTLLGLVAVRIAWGVVGTRHARFVDWVRGPRAVAAYLRERLAGRSRRHLGHNPAAGVMILSLLAGVVFMAVTGWLQTTDRFFGVEWLEEVHELAAWGLLGLVGLHVLAVAVESIHYRENLIAAMIHGRKRPLASAPQAPLPATSAGPDITPPLVPDQGGD